MRGKPGRVRSSGNTKMYPADLLDGCPNYHRWSADCSVAPSCSSNSSTAADVLPLLLLSSAAGPGDELQQGEREREKGSI